MTYNQAHFDTAVIEKIERKITMTYDCEELVQDSIITFLKSTKNYEQTENFAPFIHLIIKMRFNLEAAHRLLPLLREDYRFKTSINLLYRACLDDTINIYYLLGYVLLDNATKTFSVTQPSLGNELDILHREFLKSTIVIIESEMETDRYYTELNGETYTQSDNTKDWKQKLIDANSDLYNYATGNWKNNKEIRATSNPLFNNLFPTSNGKIPETGKMDFIKNKGYARSSQLTQLFRYFAQYQHFSPKMHDFLLTTPEHDLGYYHKMLIEMLCVVFECNQILITDNKEEGKALLEANIVKLFELYHAA